VRTCVGTVNVTASVWDFSEFGFELATSHYKFSKERLYMVSQKKKKENLETDLRTWQAEILQ
jgi:hypothetical protein